MHVKMVLGAASGVVPKAIGEIAGLLVQRQMLKLGLGGGCLCAHTLAGRSVNPELGERIAHRTHVKNSRAGMSGRVKNARIGDESVMSSSR